MKLSCDIAFGIFSWFGWVMPLPKRLELIRQAGFTSTSLWWEDEIGTPPIDRPTMAALVRDYGLNLDNVHVPYDDIDDLWSEDKSCRNNIVDRHLKWIDELAQCSIPIMVMHIMDHYYPPLPNQYGLESSGQIVAAAREAGILIAIENTGDVGLIDYVLTHIESDHLGFCYDSSHDWLYSVKKARILDKWGHRLLCTHLSDNDGKRDRHWLPGQGNIDWQLIRRFLPPNNYRGTIALEVTASRSQQSALTPQQFLEEAYERLELLFSKFSAKKQARPDAINTGQPSTL